MIIKEISAHQTIDIRHQVLWPNKPRSFCLLKNDKSGIHFGVFFEEELICVASLFKEGESMRLRKLATLPSFQGKGAASQIITHLLEFTKSLNISNFWCDARESAAPFYHKFQMIEQGDPFYKNDEPYIKMMLCLKET